MNQIAESNETKKTKIKVVRVQTGIRIEVRMLKVLKGLAEYLDITVGDLIEGIVLHAFEGQPPISNAETLRVIQTLKQVYGMDYDSSASHNFIEEAEKGGSGDERL
jgi:predicted DNA-binding ribbon-helix-helix protein